MNPTLLEYFAAHETLGDFDEMTVARWVKLKPTFEGMAGPFPDDMKSVPAWTATWRAKLRFIRAKAMVEEAERIRKESESKDHVWADMVHPLFNTPQWGDYVRQNWERIRGMQNTTYTVPSKTANLSFSEALEAMKQGKKVKRKTWDSCAAWMEDGVICVELQSGRSIRNISISNCETLANDWEILPEQPK